jgi:hypothetical protein
VFEVVAGGSLTATDLTIAGGTANVDGGGGLRVQAGASASLTDVGVYSNRTNVGRECFWLGAPATGSPTTCGPAGGGGGIQNLGTLTLNRSVVAENRSGGGLVECSTVVDPRFGEITTCQFGVGIGIHNRGTLNVVNSTISGNLPSIIFGGQELFFWPLRTYGGGIATEEPGTTNLAFTTIADNRALDGSALAGEGYSTGASVLAASDGAACQGIGQFVQPAPPFTAPSLGDNLSTDGSCDLTQPSDHPSTAPALGPFQDNGGSTRSHLPAAGSPLVDAVTDTGLCPGLVTTDQRGSARPAEIACDIGSVERQPSDP